MKKITILLFVMAAALVSACDLDVRQDPIADGNIVIRLGLDDLATKSAGTDDENAVNVLDVFVFSSDGSTQLYYDSPTPTLVDGTNYYQQIIHLADMASGTSGTDVRNAKVFAIANYTGGETLTGKTLAQLKAIAVDADEFRDGNAVKEHPVFVMTAEGAFHQGTGSDAGKAIANLSLKRLAAKLTLTIAYGSPLTTTEKVVVFGQEFDATKTWTPMINGENIRVFLQNAAGNAVLGGASVPPSYPATPSRFTYGTTFVDGPDDLDQPRTSKPFYSYPVDLTAVAGTNDEPFLKLIQPWEYVTTINMGGGDEVVVDRNVVELYYKIMLPASVTSLDANTWYQPTVTLKVLGGEASRTPVVIGADAIQVLDWKAVGGDGDNSISDVAFVAAKFISLDNPDGTFVVERGESESFHVVASGPLNMSIREISFTKFIQGTYPSSLAQVGTDVDGTGGKETVYVINNGSVESAFSSRDPESWVTYSDDGFGGVLNLVHTLSTDVSSDDFSITPYRYVIRLSLTSDSSVYKDVTITQKPSMAVSNAISKGKVFVNNTRNDSFTQSKYANTSDYVYLTNNLKKLNDGRYQIPQGKKHLGYLPRLDLEGYSTRSRFRFIFTVVPYDNLHMVTDTRTDITDDNVNAFTRIGNQGTSSSYYQSENLPSPYTGLPITNNSYDIIANSTNIFYKGATIEKDYISPEFMLASSYGGISGLTNFGQALLRCATYQEDGYPAGRWRLPTESELVFIESIQAKGLIPMILADGTWASSGRVYTTYGTQPNNRFRSIYEYNGHTTRCVYDTWYWGADPVVDENTYTVKINKD